MQCDHCVIAAILYWSSLAYTKTSHGVDEKGSLVKAKNSPSRNKHDTNNHDVDDCYLYTCSSPPIGDVMYCRFFVDFFRFFWIFLYAQRGWIPKTPVKPRFGDVATGWVPKTPTGCLIWTDFGQPIGSQTGQNRYPTLAGIFRGPV